MHPELQDLQTMQTENILWLHCHLLVKTAWTHFNMTADLNYA